MKKIILTILLAFSFLGHVWSGTLEGHKGTVSEIKLMSTIGKYRGEPEFTVLRIGRIGTFLAKSVAGIMSRMDDYRDDNDLRDLRDLARGIHRFTFVKFDECDKSTRASLGRELNLLFSNSEPLIEVKHADEGIQLFGLVNDRADKIKDIILYIPAECVLVCLYGDIPSDKLLDVVQRRMI